MKKNIILLAALVTVIGALFVLSVAKYQTAPITISTQEAITQRDDALKALQIRDQTNQANEQVLNDQITKLKEQVTTATNQKTTLCAQIKAAKLAQPLCQ